MAWLSGTNINPRQASRPDVVSGPGPCAVTVRPIDLSQIVLREWASQPFSMPQRKPGALTGFGETFHTDQKTRS
jgi:hypothetical protein